MIEFILNDRTIKTRTQPGMTLLDFVRYEQNLVGTKIGCREGDCGACSILLGEVVDGKMEYKSMTSCITPLGNAAGKHVVTVEGVNMIDLSPAQKAMVDQSGTQCGICTVGFVVTLTGYCLSAEKPTVEGAISAIDGNICRCTGYKSIERAAAVVSDLLADKDLSDPVPWLIKNNFLPDYFSKIPARLDSLNVPPPPTNGAPIVGGGTDLYVQRHEEMHEQEEIHLYFHKKEFNGIFRENGRIFLGSAVTPTDILKSEEMKAIFPRLYEHMKLVSSTPIRNMGTIAGNFVNASPIGDLTAYFIALDASIALRNKIGEEREIKLKDLYLDYKKLSKTEDESIARIFFDVPDEHTKFNFEKVCKRTYLDIASVNSAIRISVSGGIITDVHLSAGGVGPIPKYLAKTCEFLNGKSITPEIIADAGEIIQSEISPISDVRGTADYKRFLLRQLFYAHFIELFPEEITLSELV